MKILRILSIIACILIIIANILAIVFGISNWPSGFYVVVRVDDRHQIDLSFVRWASSSLWLFDCGPSSLLCVWCWLNSKSKESSRYSLFSMDSLDVDLCSYCTWRALLWIFIHVYFWLLKFGLLDFGSTWWCQCWRQRLAGYYCGHLWLAVCCHWRHLLHCSQYFWVTWTKIYSGMLLFFCSESKEGRKCLKCRK